MNEKKRRVRASVEGMRLRTMNGARGCGRLPCHITMVYLATIAVDALMQPYKQLARGFHEPF